jgi:ABC-type transport system involved in multi-copper enzyme maturation permease subunit
VAARPSLAAGFLYAALTGGFMGLAIGLVLIAGLYIFLAAAFASENKGIKQKPAALTMAGCIALCIIGSIFALLISIRTNLDMDGQVTYQACAHSEIVDRDPDTNNPISECANYETKTVTVGQYFHDNITSWVLYGTAVGSLILFFVIVGLNKNIQPNKR